MRLRRTEICIKELLEAAEPQDVLLLSHYNYGDDRVDSADELVSAIRANGSHELKRIIRGEAHYLEIVRTVAKQMGLVWQENEDEETLEKKILAHILQQSWRRMSEEERQAVGEKFTVAGVDSAYLSELLIEGAFVQMLPSVGYLVVWNTARIVAAATAHETGVLAAEGLLGGLAAELLGPLGIVTGVIIFLVSLAGPAFRKIIPTVIHVAYMRQKNRLHRTETKHEDK